jgi:hypothetical protein
MSWRPDPITAYRYVAAQHALGEPIVVRWKAAAIAYFAPGDRTDLRTLEIKEWMLERYTRPGDGGRIVVVSCSSWDLVGGRPSHQRRPKRTRLVSHRRSDARSFPDSRWRAHLPLSCTHHLESDSAQEVRMVGSAGRGFRKE